METQNNVITKLTALSQLGNLNIFYSVGFWTSSGLISLQGKFNEDTAAFAKAFECELIFDNENGWLSCTKDSVQITLTF